MYIEKGNMRPVPIMTDSDKIKLITKVINKYIEDVDYDSYKGMEDIYSILQGEEDLSF